MFLYFGFLSASLFPPPAETPGLLRSASASPAADSLAVSPSLFCMSLAELAVAVSCSLSDASPPPISQSLPVHCGVIVCPPSFSRRNDDDVQNRQNK